MIILIPGKRYDLRVPKMKVAIIAFMAERERGTLS